MTRKIIIEDHDDRNLALKTWKLNGISRRNLKFDSEGVNRIHFILFNEYHYRLEFFRTKGDTWEKRITKLYSPGGLNVKLDRALEFSGIVRLILIDYAVRHCLHLSIDDSLNVDIGLRIFFENGWILIEPMMTNRPIRSKTIKIGLKNTKEKFDEIVKTVHEQYILHRMAE